MILVSFSGVEHDNNICVYDNGTIRYSKCERDVGIKHSSCAVGWYYKKLQDWNIDYRKVDAFVSSIDAPRDTKKNVLPYFSKLDRTRISYPMHNKNSLNFFINHHFAHIFSNKNFSYQKSKGIVLDGYSFDRYSSWSYSPEFDTPKMYKHISSGVILDKLGYKIGLSGDPLDFAGKIMGLQSYGNPDYKIINQWKDLIPQKNNLFLKWMKNYKIDCNFKDQVFFDFVATVFWTCYEINKSYFDSFSKEDEIIFSGGTALNVNWNRKLLDLGYNLNIQPHVNDESISIGGLRFLCELYNVPFEIPNFPYCQDDEAPTTKPSKETTDRVAELLAKGKIVGWYQGHGEIGPRALGNRSILMRPDIPKGKDILNEKVKHREWWRPFGASVKQDKASEYFDLDNSPYMLYTAKVLNSDLHSITHVDGTCRHQTVTPEQNSLFYDLLDSFESKTGLPVLLNTSLNLGGKPIAGKIEEAIELFKTSGIDALCVGNDLYIK